MSTACCEYCKSSGQITGDCAFCGRLLWSGMAAFIFGTFKNESRVCELHLTDRYLIVRPANMGAAVGSVAVAAIGGLVGGLIAEGVTAAKRSAEQRYYAFYDLRDVRRIIFPYFAKNLKGHQALRFEYWDGSDFVLLFNQNGLFGAQSAQKFAAELMQLGLAVENGTGCEQPVCCFRPLVNAATFANYLAPSAAFVEQQSTRLAAGASYSASPEQGYFQPAQRNATEQPQPTNVPPARATLLCPDCGTELPRRARFCSKCGRALLTWD